MFKTYKRKSTADLRPITQKDLSDYKKYGGFIVRHHPTNPIKVSISQVDLENGSPRIGDYIARNPKDHTDQWLVSETYFNNNFEPIEE